MSYTTESEFFLVDRLASQTNSGGVIWEIPAPRDLVITQLIIWNSNSTQTIPNAWRLRLQVNGTDIGGAGDIVSAAIAARARVFVPLAVSVKYGQYVSLRTATASGSNRGAFISIIGRLTPGQWRKKTAPSGVTVRSLISNQ